MSAFSGGFRLSIGILGRVIALLLILFSACGGPGTGNTTPTAQTSSTAPANAQATSSAIAQATANAQASATAIAQATANAQASATAIAQAIPSVTITSPQKNAMVGSPITVSGNASNIPAGKELWLFVQAAGVPGYFPQLVGDPTNPQPIMIFPGGTWSIEAHIGLDNSTASVGKTFMLIPALIDQTDSKAHEAIKKYFQDGYIPIEPLPSTIQLLTPDQVQVTRM